MITTDRVSMKGNGKICLSAPVIIICITGFSRHVSLKDNVQINIKKKNIIKIIVRII